MRIFLHFVQLDHRNVKARKPRVSLHPGTEKPISKMFPRGSETHVLHQHHVGTSEGPGTSQPQHLQPGGSMPTKQILYTSVKSTLPAQFTAWSLKATTCVLLPVLSVATHLAISARTIRHVLLEPQPTSSSSLSWMEVE